MFLGVLIMSRLVNLIVDEEYFDLVPRPTKEDRHSLKQSILADGQQLPIVVNHHKVILDGHTRFEICNELHLKTKFVVKRFPSKYEERKFVIMSNLARRNLSKFQKIEMCWDIYENEKKRAWERVSSQGGPNWKGTHNRYGAEREGNAAEIFGKYMDSGHTTIAQVQWLKQNTNKSMLKKLRDGKISISKAYHLVKGLSLTRGKWRKPEKPSECPHCGHVVISKKESKCHVHRWFCCTNPARCKWGI